MNDHVPSLSTIVDMLTARIEHAEHIGNAPEATALRIARTAVLDHVFREDRQMTWIARILVRLHIEKRAAA